MCGIYFKCKVSNTFFLDGNTALLRIIAEISRNKWKDQTREFNFLFQNVKDLASLLDCISSLGKTI